MNTVLSRSIAGLLIVSMTGIGMPTPAQADTTTRSEARAQLIKHGVNRVDADARVAVLTDDEAAHLAAGIDDLPAGGNPALGLFGALLFAGMVVALLPFIVVGGIVVLAVKNSGKGNGNGVVAPAEDFGPQ